MIFINFFNRAIIINLIITIINLIVSYIDLKHFINLLLIELFIYNEFIKFSSKSSKNLLRKFKKNINIIQIIFMIIIIIIF